MPGVLPGGHSVPGSGDRRVRHDRIRQGPGQSVHEQPGLGPELAGSQNPMYSANRQPPSFEFNPGRLFLDPEQPGDLNGYDRPGIPGYYDNLGN